MYGGDYMQEISMKPTARIYNFSELQKKKRQRELRETPILLQGSFNHKVCSAYLFFIFGDSVVEAQEPTTDIRYKVVEIKAGDSLWSIAKENMSDELNHSGFTDIYQYIHEIKKCNNMKSNQINAGCYLMVPYYK